jgi:pimeloyl-ACP methyl ester carboxylesterase
MLSFVRIPLSTGIELAGVLEQPEVSTPAPLVLLLHGFTGWKEEEHIVSLASALTSAGIASLRIDAPGSGESGGTFAEHYRLSAYIDSVAEVLDWCSAQSAVDGERLGIWGHSMGGFAAIAAAVRNADRLRAVCGSQASRGKAGVPEDVRQAWEETGWASFRNMHFRKLDLPYDFFVDRAQFDVFEVLPELHLPLCLIAGTRDVEVSAAHVHKAFATANEPKELHEFNVDHFYKKSARQSREINTVTVAFFEKHL